MQAPPALVRLLEEYKFKITPDFSGKWRRFDLSKPGDKNLAWMGRQITVEEETLFYAYWKDWTTGQEYRWNSKGSHIPPKFKEAMKKAEEEIEAENSATQEKIAKSCKIPWDCFLPHGTTPYLERKGLPGEKYGLFGCKIMPRGNSRILIVPAKDTEGKLWTFQEIQPEKIDDLTDKKFVKGGRKKGHFHTIGEISPEGVLYVTEGLATAATVSLALTAPVIVAFDAGNLPPVCRNLRAKYPKVQLVLCADHDQWKDHGGERGARKAVEESGGEYCLPHFRPDVGTPTDFNDLYQLEGLDEVRRQVLDNPRFSLEHPNPLYRSQTESGKSLPKATPPSPMAREPLAPEPATVFPISGEMEPPVPTPTPTAQPEIRQEKNTQPELRPAAPITPIRGTGALKVVERPVEQGAGYQAQGPGGGGKPGKMNKPSETEIALRIIEELNGNIRRQGKSLFRYNEDFFWEEMDPVHIDKVLKNRINAQRGLVLNSREVDSTFKTLIRYLPEVPRDRSLFNPNPFCVNLKNGTLHAVQSKDHHYSLEFLPHHRENYVTNRIELEYDPERKAVNTEFLAMIGRVFEGDVDQEEKIRAVKQMYGACLMSLFPHFFFLIGKKQTGKSTVIQIAEQLVSKQNKCSVQPHEFNGFNMESMIGKLLNSDTDIATNEPITDNQIKKVIDRREFRIERKGLADIYGYLPGTHVFGGNAMPPTLEGMYQAYDRRITFIEFKNVQGVGQYDKEFWLWLWEQSPEGILNFALEGLEDLLINCRGHYVNPASGKIAVEEWQAKEDVISQFLTDIREGEVVYIKDRLIEAQGAKIKRGDLYVWFRVWSSILAGNRYAVGKKTFYSGLEMKGIRASHEENGWFYLGFDGPPLPDARY